MLIDLSLNILKNYEPRSIVEKQKSSLEYLHYMNPKNKTLVIRFGMQNYREKKPFYDLITFKKNLLSLTTFLLFKRLLKGNSGVIICHGFGTPLCFMLLKVMAKDRFDIYVQHHGGEPFQNIVKLFLQRCAYKNVKGYFFTSSGNAKKFISDGIIKNENYVFEVMEGSCSFHLLNKENCRTKLGLEDGLLLLWVGRLNKNKDPLTVLNAYCKFVQTHKTSTLFMIYGTDELKKDIDLFIKQNNIEQNVKLIGNVAHRELEKWYNAADVYVSASYSEGSGYALCEALACGCYPVTTNIPSFVWMTGNGNVGKHYHAGNSDELYKILSEIDTVSIGSGRLQRRKHFEDLLSFKAIAKTINTTIHQEEK